MIVKLCLGSQDTCWPPALDLAVLGLSLPCLLVQGKAGRLEPGLRGFGIYKAPGPPGLQKARRPTVPEGHGPGARQAAQVQTALYSSLAGKCRKRGFGTRANSLTDIINIPFPFPGSIHRVK